MTICAGRGAAAARVADALLRVSGRKVLLRMPAPAVPGDMTEQIGLAVPEFQDAELVPVVFRALRASAAAVSGKTGAQRWELMVSAKAVRRLTGTLGYGSASVLFGDAAGVLVDEVLLEIEEATELEAGGVGYLHRLVVREPLRLVV